MITDQLDGEDGRLARAGDYEAPTVQPIGNLHDLVANTGASQCDALADSSAIPDGTC
jgi:hypothetical protein